MNKSRVDGKNFYPKLYYGRRVSRGKPNRLAVNGHALTISLNRSSIRTSIVQKKNKTRFSPTIVGESFPPINERPSKTFLAIINDRPGEIVGNNRITARRIVRFIVIPYVYIYTHTSLIIDYFKMKIRFDAVEFY